MTTYPAPNPPFIGARHHGGSQTPKAIVMHATVSSDNPGTARSIAEWWHGASSPITSAHYVVDPKEIVQCVGDRTIAYHCGYNTGSISIEMCDEQTGPASRWNDADSTAIVKSAARLAAELCLAYGIEPVRPTVAQLKAKGPHGIYGHNDSRLAFGNTTHTDPKDFNWTKFLSLVKLEIAAIKKAAEKPPVVKPPSKPTYLQRFHTALTGTRHVVDLDLLDAAVKAGRRGAVKTARDEIDAAMHALIKKYPKEKSTTRLGQVIHSYKVGREIPMVPFRASANARPGVRGYYQDIEALAKGAPKS